MSALTNVWRQLVQRRLWPVAILLIAALAAVPLALAKEPDPAAPVPAVAAVDGESALAVQPIVAQATASERDKRRKVLGARKNPFGLPELEDASATPPSSTVVNTAQAPTTAASGGTSSPVTITPASGGTSPSTSSPSTPPASDPTPAPRKFALNELTVRFGDAAGQSLERKSLKRLQPLPSAEEPVLIYLGVLKDGKSAVFMVDDGVTAVGDGDCAPTPDECDLVRMRAGDTEFLDVADDTGVVTAQYRFDLVKVKKIKTASASRATASSKAGRRLLKTRVAADGPTGYRWDAATGVLERRPGRALRATVASATVSLP